MAFKAPTSNESSAAVAAAESAKQRERPGPVRRNARRARAAASRVDEAMQVSGAYAHTGRPILNVVILLAILPFVLVLGVIVAALNLCAFGDPRKILYSQPRVGWRGRVFRIYKFRTMREVKASAHESWRAGSDGARVTKLGRCLRNMHLDELPQVWNIVKGDMNVIGPRPEMIEIEAWASKHVEGFSRRLVIKPGITGIAQITQGYTGHDVGAYAEKLAINLRYVEEMSLGLDVEICWRTAMWMVRGRGWKWDRRGIGVGERER